MNTPSLQLQINRLDDAYQRFSDHHFRASGVVTGREQAWHAFIQAGYGFKELETTLVWIKDGIRKGKRHEPALGFRRLIMDLATFEDEHAAAMAERRNAKPHASPKERVLVQARPVALPERVLANDSAQHVSVYIKALRDAVGGAK